MLASSSLLLFKNAEKSLALLLSFKKFEIMSFSRFVSASFNPSLQIPEQNKIANQ